MENQIDEFFKSRLDEAELPVGSSSWEKLEERLHGRKQARLPIYAAAAMVVFTLVTGLWLINRPMLENDVTPIANEKTKMNSITPPEINKEEATTFISELVESVQSANSPVLERAVVDYSIHDTSVEVNPTQEESKAIETYSLPADIAVSENQEIQTQPEVQVSGQDVVIYELISETNFSEPTQQKPNLFKTITDLKRNGIPLGAVKDLKEEVFNRLLRSPQRTTEKKQRLKQS